MNNIYYICWMVLLVNLPVSSRAAIDLDAAADEYRADASIVDAGYYAVLERMMIAYTNQLARIEAAYKAKGDLDRLLNVKQAIEACRTTGAPEPPSEQAPREVRQLYQQWKASKSKALKSRYEKLHYHTLEYLKEMRAAKRELTQADKLEDAIRADELGDEAQKFLEQLRVQPDLGLLVKIAPSPPEVQRWSGRDLLQLKALIWNGQDSRWALQPLAQLKQEWQGDVLTLGIRQQDRYRMVKVVLPVELEAGSRVTFDVRNSGTLELIDPQHRERCAYMNSQDQPDWQIVNIDLSEPDKPRFLRDQTVIAHRTSELTASGKKRIPEQLNVAGFFPGFTILNGRDVQIRRIEIR